MTVGSQSETQAKDVIAMISSKIQTRTPFTLRVPNAETLETFAQTDAGRELHYCETKEEMFEQLGIR